MKRRRCKTKGCQATATHGDYCYDCAVETPAPLWG